MPQIEILGTVTVTPLLPYLPIRSAYIFQGLQPFLAPLPLEIPALSLLVPSWDPTLQFSLSPLQSCLQGLATSLCPLLSMILGPSLEWRLCWFLFITYGYAVLCLFTVYPSLWQVLSPPFLLFSLDSIPFLE